MNRQQRRQMAKKRFTTAEIKGIAKDACDRQMGTADALARERFNQSLAVSTNFVLASVVLAIDALGYWKRGSKRYDQLFEEFQKQYEGILESDAPLELVSKADDVTGGGMPKIIFDAEG